jgi:hypothetical protein
MWKIIHYVGFFVYAKFYEQIFMKIIFLIIFLHCNVCDTLLQIKNVLPLIIELLIHAPISQHYDNLGCYPPLIAHFHQKNPPQIIYINSVSLFVTGVLGGGGGRGR